MNKVDEERIVCIVGRSGVGKSLLVDTLSKLLGLKVLPSYTTRPRRHEKEEGHVFVHTEDFIKLKDQLVAYTIFDGHEYGATKQQIRDNHLYIIDPSGVDYMKQHYDPAKVFIVYIDASPDVIEKRLNKDRGEEHAKARIEHDVPIYNPRVYYDLYLVNDTVQGFGYCLKMLEHVVNDFLFSIDSRG